MSEKKEGFLAVYVGIGFGLAVVALVYLMKREREPFHRVKKLISSCYKKIEEIEEGLSRLKAGEVKAR